MRLLPGTQQPAHLGDERLCLVERAGRLIGVDAADRVVGDQAEIEERVVRFAVLRGQQAGMDEIAMQGGLHAGVLYEVATLA